jgi:hypothetical protein
LSKVLAAADRLALSREQLRQAMRASAAASQSQPGLPGSLPDWARSLKALPGVSILIEALRVWWSRQPLRVAVQVAADIGNTVLRPLAQRHPLRLVFGAMCAGGLLAWSRPWRLTRFGPLRRLFAVGFGAG